MARRRPTKPREGTVDEFFLRLLKAGHLRADPVTGKVFYRRIGRGKEVAWRETKGTISRKGYLGYSARHNQARAYIFFHRLMWIAAYGIPPEGTEVHHINENKLDNRLINLELLTRNEHEERHRKADYDAVRAEVAKGKSHREVAGLFGISRPSVTRICG